MDWNSAQAPGLDDFAVLAQACYGALPEPFRALTEGIVMRIEDFADEEVLKDLGLESPFDLMGLYQGIDLGHASAFDTPRPPNMVFLYRRAILDLWAEGEETLGGLIRHVLVHEIGHHFGLSDEDMERIEAEAGP